MPYRYLSTLLALALALLIGAPVAMAAPAAQGALPPEITGVTWELVSLTPAGGAAEETTGSGITLAFGPENAANGSGGCNNYRTSYTLAGDGNIKFDMPAATLRACEDAVNQREMAFFTALSAVTTYSVADGRVTLTAPDGAELVFAASAGGAPAATTPPAQLPSTGGDDLSALWLALAAALAAAGLLLRQRAARMG